MILTPTLGGCPDQEGRWHPVPASDSEDPWRSPLQTRCGPQVSGTNIAQIPLSLSMMLQHWNLLFASQKDVHVYENDPLCGDLLLLRCFVAAPQLSPGADI